MSKRKKDPATRKWQELQENFGYVPQPDHQEKLAEDSIDRYGASAIDDLPVDMDVSAFPYRAAAKVLKGNQKYVSLDGLLLALSQGSFGSCIGWGFARAALVTLAAGIFLRGLEIEWPTDDQGNPVSISPSWMYGAARTVNGDLGRYQGANGSNAAQALERMGFIWERDYGDFDCSKYSIESCDRWDTFGVPKESLPHADDNLLKGRYRVENCEQLVALCQSGYGTGLCGPDKPIGKTRGDFGELKFNGRRWSHCETVIGYASYKIKPTKTERFFTVLNSHGSNAYSGPKGKKSPDMPNGAYNMPWLDMERSLQRRDSWVNFSLEGLTPATRKWKSLIG